MKVLFCRLCARKIKVGGQSSFIRVHAAQLKKSDRWRKAHSQRRNTKSPKSLTWWISRRWSVRNSSEMRLSRVHYGHKASARYRSSASAMLTIRNQRVIKQPTWVINMFPGRFFCHQHNQANVARGRHFFRGRLRAQPLDSASVTNR